MLNKDKKINYLEVVISRLYKRSTNTMFAISSEGSDKIKNQYLLTECAIIVVNLRL